MLSSYEEKLIGIANQIKNISKFGFNNFIFFWIFFLKLLELIAFNIFYKN